MCLYFRVCLIVVGFFEVFHLCLFCFDCGAVVLPGVL